MCRIEYADNSGLWLTPLGEHRANKDHTCSDCHRTILKGETYTNGVWLDQENGYIVRTKMCAQCVAAGDWLQVVCGGHFWPGVVEELREHWDEEWELRSVGLGRLVKLGEAKWHRDGRLVSLEDVKRWTAEAVARVPESARH